MAFIGIVELIHKTFMMAYAAFVIWTIIRYTQTNKLLGLSVRDYFGLIGLAAGLISSGLLGWFYLFLTFAHRLIAHGATLWLYYYAGMILAIVCLICGLVTRRWLRLSCIFISMVMLFQWYGRMIVGVREEAILQISMLISLACATILTLAIQFFTRKLRRAGSPS